MRTYSTNEICKLCDVSRKQLRYYEERGLLSSVPRDEGNNYRYYTSEHIYEIVAAKALRRIDMPLSEMKDLIYGNNVGHIQLSLQRQIDSARDNLENSLRQYEQSVRVYTRLVEALSLLRLHSGGGGELPIEMVDCARRDIVPCPTVPRSRMSFTMMWITSRASRASRRALMRSRSIRWST